METMEQQPEDNNNDRMKSFIDQLERDFVIEMAILKTGQNDSIHAIRFKSLRAMQYVSAN